MWTKTWFLAISIIYGFAILSIAYYIAHVTMIQDSVKPIGKVICTHNISRKNSDCSLICSNLSYFSFPFMERCHNWLNCKEINSTKKLRYMEKSMAREVSLEVWNGYRVVKRSYYIPMEARNSSNMTEFLEVYNEVHDDIEIYKKMKRSPYVVEFIGSCDYHTAITKYYEFGSMRDISSHLRARTKLADTLQLKFVLGINYLRMLESFHTNVPGPLTICGGNSIKRYFHQFLVDSDLTIVLGDLSSLKRLDPAVPNVCKRITSKFAAPEETSENSTVTEKKDIWKIPFVMEHLLGEEGVEAMEPYLGSIHRQCQTLDPMERPNASVVLDAYIKVVEHFSMKSSKVGHLFNI